MARRKIIEQVAHRLTWPDSIFADRGIREYLTDLSVTNVLAIAFPAQATHFSNPSRECFDFHGAIFYHARE